MTGETNTGVLAKLEPHIIATFEDDIIVHLRRGKERFSERRYVISPEVIHILAGGALVHMGQNNNLLEYISGHVIDRVHQEGEYSKCPLCATDELRE